jgi:Putative sensor
VSAVSELSLRRDPIRLLLSRGLWTSAWYLLGYLAVGWALFAIALSTAVGGAGLSVTLAGLPVLVAAAATIRWCADVERARLRPMADGPVGGRYRQVAGSGVMARLRTRWRDPATWRDVAYVVGMYVPLLALDTIVLAVWWASLAAITLPIWYWAPWQTIHGVRYHGSQLGYFPHGPHPVPGDHSWGLYIDTLPKALAVAGVGLILFLLFNYILVLTARAHAAVARGLLSAAEDPLREAKDVLSRPGPLPSNLRA